MNVASGGGGSRSAARRLAGMHYNSNKHRMNLSMPYHFGTGLASRTLGQLALLGSGAFSGLHSAMSGSRHHRKKSRHSLSAPSR
jgi:hypothetical protein